jgi:uncharacterized protein (TIGR02646 family)
VIPIRRPNADEALDAAARAYLERKAAEAKGFPPGDQRIRRAWENFLRTVARRKVEEALDLHSRGKCAYCKNIAAKDIEHFYPKSAHPSRMFAWDNFLRGCKNCNNAKVDRFPLDGAGAPLLIDPCIDEPLDYFVWDGLTGAMVVATDPAREARALATREVLPIDHEPLREERRSKLLVTLYLLIKVVEEDPVSPKTRDLLHDQMRPHRPWLGIVRQLLVRPSDDVRPLVDAALAKLPEIRSWAEVWL